MALKTWDEIGNLGLTNAQKNALAAFEAVGVAVAAGQTPVIVAPVTPENARKVKNFYRDLNRIRLAYAGARYVLKKVEDDAAKAARDAVPDGSL